MKYSKMRSLMTHNGLAIIGLALVFFLFIWMYSFDWRPFTDVLTLGEAKSRSELKEGRWLIATMTPAHSFQRRAIIRNTWQRLYKAEDKWVTRFVIANPGELWEKIIELENATYGDLLLLPHLEESRWVANTIKTVELYKYIISNEPDRWDFVSKIDDDSFLDARNFYYRYLELLIAGQAEPDRSSDSVGDVNFTAAGRTSIGRTLFRDGYNYPGGQFYTLSRDLVALVAKLHDENPIDNEDEDVLIGRLLHEGGHSWRHIDLPNQVAFDYADVELRTQGLAFAEEGADLTGPRHAVGSDALNPHKMRDDDVYLKVASCFDETGSLAHRGSAAKR